MAKIKSFYHQIEFEHVFGAMPIKLPQKPKSISESDFQYELRIETSSTAYEKKVLKHFKPRSLNIDQLEYRDNEINAFIDGKKIISITTATETVHSGHGSKTKGYLTTILYEDE